MIKVLKQKDNSDITIDSDQEQILKFLNKVETAPTFELAALTHLDMPELDKSLKELTLYNLIEISGDDITLNKEGKKIIKRLRRNSSRSNFWFQSK